MRPILDRSISVQALDIEDDVLLTPVGLPGRVGEVLSSTWNIAKPC